MLSGFDYIPVVVSVLLLIILFFIAISYQAKLVSYYEYQEECIGKSFIKKYIFVMRRAFSQKRAYFFIPLAVFCLFLSIFTPIISSGLCICAYNTGYGLQISESLELSSEYLI
jgi:hypothetical protein